MRPPKSIIQAALLVCLSLSLSALQVQAQQAVELKFITFPQVMKPLEMEMIISADETLKIQCASNELSEAYRVPRLAKMVFGEQTVDAEGKPKFNVFGTGNMAAGNKQVVMILRKGKDLSEGFEVRSISSDPNDFGGGKLLFLNATNKSIAGIAGQKRFALQPGRQAVIKPDLMPNGRLTQVSFFYEEDGNAVPFFDSTWPIGENNRGLVFFCHDPNNQNKIRLHSFRDFMVPNE